MTAKRIVTSLYSLEQIRAMEQALFKTHPSYSVMYYAGVSVFEYLLNHYGGRTFHIVLGSGNNAGDGLVLAGLLKRSGQSVYCYCLFNKDYQGDAAKAYTFSIKHQVEFVDSTLFPADTADSVLVDAVFGIGFRGELAPEIQETTQRLNQQCFHQRIAIDIASGLQADSGKAATHTLWVDKTLTFIGHKPGLYYLDGKAVSGEVICFTLGAIQPPPTMFHYRYQLTDKQKVVAQLGNQNKSDFGHLLVIGGGEGMFGAVALASIAALKTGTGRVTLFSHSAHQADYHFANTDLFEVMRLTDIDKCRDYPSVCLGPGLGRDAWAESIFSKVLRKENIVIDADGLYWLANKPQALTKSAVITPHEAEAARLLDCTVADIRHDKVKAVLALAQKYNCIAVLKGAGTLISDGKVVYINSSGNQCLATAGAGDVLAGIIGGLLAQGQTAMEAALLGVYLHGLAADNYQHNHAGKSMRASDLFTYLADII